MEINIEKRIRQLRNKKRLSQDEIAKLCKVSRQTINSIENDKYDPIVTLAFELAKQLETTVDMLFFYPNK